jgi:agmatinase
MAGPTPTLIGVPWDVHSSFMRGAAAAPPLVRQALFSPASNMWSELGVDLGAPGRLADAGDIRGGFNTCVRRTSDAARTGVETTCSLSDSAGAIALIEEGIRKLMDDGGAPLAIGGDHAVTYPVVRAVAARHPGLTILHIDAHPDLYDEFEGNRLSHACPFARIMEEGLAARLVQVGIRAANGHQREQARRFGVDVIDMRAWAAGTRPALSSPVYVSIDLDGLDPAFAPGVSHREPGGLTVRDVIGLLHALPAPPVGADIVEFNPSQDPLGLTAHVAAKLVKELAGRMHGA